MNKDTKILLVLLAVVVLCSAKLLKDYLYRNQYIEGMTVVSQESSVQLRRPTTGSITADIMFTVTLGGDLLSTSALYISWSGAAAATNDVVFPSAATNYTATASGYTIPSPAAAVTGMSATFGSSAIKIPSGTRILITIKGVTINNKKSSGSADYTDPDSIEFTITGATGDSTKKVIKILPYADIGSSKFTAPTGATVTQVRDSITAINTRLQTTGVTAPDAAEVDNLTKARSALIALLASTYGTVKEAGEVFESGALYEAQQTAIEFISKEKARASSNADALSSDNLNKRRMAQINTYYTRNYEANTNVMKNVIYISVSLIILAVLRNKNLIPSSISTLGIVLILTMGGIVIGTQVFDIMSRNDQDFDKYDWNFNEEQMNQKTLSDKNSEMSSLSDMGIGGAPCYGASCCSVGTTWNSGMKQCIPSVNRISGSAVWTPPASGSLTGKLTVKLTIATALLASDTITITLPSGVFTGTAALTSHNQLTGTTVSTTTNTLTVKTGGISVGNVADIEITGMSVLDSATYLQKQLTASTSKDVNELGIIISGF